MDGAPIHKHGGYQKRFTLSEYAYEKYPLGSDMGFFSRLCYMVPNSGKVETKFVERLKGLTELIRSHPLASSVSNHRLYMEIQIENAF